MQKILDKKNLLQKFNHNNDIVPDYLVKIRKWGDIELWYPKFYNHFILFVVTKILGTYFLRTVIG